MGARGRRRPVGTVAVALTLVCAGLLFATSARSSPDEPIRYDDLVGLIESGQKANADKSAKVAELEKEVQQLQDAAGVPAPASDSSAGLVALASGSVPVSGPGLTVTLNDAPPDTVDTTRSDVNINRYVVHQQDLQAVLNALWAGGAEAMTIQGQRLTATSAVRCVGNTLVLHGRVYSPPYVISAIGDQKAMTKALSAAPDVRAYKADVEALGLGWSVNTVKEISMPAYDGPLDLRYARVDAGSTSGASVKETP